MSDRRLSYRLWTAVSSSATSRLLLVEGNLVGRSQVAVDVHLRAFAADAGVTGLQYEELRAVYEEAAAALGHEPGGMEHAVWRFKSRAV
ncbi:hypothetical protein [Streptomyces sp. NPDC004008]